MLSSHVLFSLCFFSLSVNLLLSARSRQRNLEEEEQEERRKREWSSEGRVITTSFSFFPYIPLYHQGKIEIKEKTGEKKNKNSNELVFLLRGLRFHLPDLLQKFLFLFTYIYLVSHHVLFSILPSFYLGSLSAYSILFLLSSYVLNEATLISSSGTKIIGFLEDFAG